MQKANTLDFAGQDIYVGLDIGKKSWQTCILVGDMEHKTFNQTPKTKTLIHYLHHNFPCAHYHCVYEAGYSGYRIHEQLRESGIECMVVNPEDVPTKYKEYSTKTNTNRCSETGERTKE
ncbi:MAG: hypothetical protein M1381_08220 [Deltaproteobacteria bacterium]|nr:hypothetical protein [Deltaproteobacteria bacterium]